MTHFLRVIALMITDILYEPVWEKRCTFRRREKRISAILTSLAQEIKRLYYRRQRLIRIRITLLGKHNHTLIKALLEDEKNKISKYFYPKYVQHFRKIIYLKEDVYFLDFYDKYKVKRNSWYNRERS